MRAFASHITDIQNGLLQEFMLDTKAPLLVVGRLVVRSDSCDGGRGCRYGYGTTGNIRKGRVCNRDRLDAWRVGSDRIFITTDRGNVISDSVPTPNRCLAFPEWIPSKAKSGGEIAIPFRTDLIAERRVFAADNKAVQGIACSGDEISASIDLWRLGRIEGRRIEGIQ